jgi:DNA gyrase subunit B
MDKSLRTLRRVNLKDALAAEEIFKLLMGDEVPPRKSFIIENANTFDRQKIDV